MHRCLLFLLGLIFALRVPAQPIREYLDLQMHPTMHQAYRFFGRGLEYFPENNPPKLSHRHLLTNVNHANFWDHNPGARIIVHGSILPEVLVARKRARARILAQIAYVDDFVAAHADRFAVARSPEEVRQLVHTTDKTIVIHSIEGAKRLLDGPEDARFWAGQGIAFMTLIHLMDDEFGGAAILPDWTTRLINWKGTLRQKLGRKPPRGLTDKGRQAIQWLTDAGIMTDITHMSDSSRADALTYMEAHGIPPLATHDMFKPLHNHPRGISKADIVRIYRLGGMVALPVSGASCRAHHPEEAYAAQLAALARHCPGSIDSYKFSYRVLQEFVEGEVVDHLLAGESAFLELGEAEKVDFAIGFQSDFNGWLDHHRPRYGAEGCWEKVPGTSYEAVELVGMPHPGTLESHWKLLEKEGVDLQPILRASEKFLQMWEHFRARRQ
ncbi:MAG: membrane dipeptidase [Bacteroidota bacterium]